MAENNDPSDQAEKMIRAIGKFIWNFNGLDEGMNNALGVLLNPGDVARGEITGSAMAFRIKSYVVYALIGHVYGDDAAEGFHPLKKRLEKINDVRNDLAHGEQWFNLEGELRQRRSRITPKGYHPKHTDYTPDDVSAKANEVTELEHEVWTYVKNLKQ